MKKSIIIFLTLLFVSIASLTLLPEEDANASVTIYCDPPKIDTCVEGTTPEGGTWIAKGNFRMEVQ